MPNCILLSPPWLVSMLLFRRSISSNIAVTAPAVWLVMDIISNTLFACVVIKSPTTTSNPLYTFGFGVVGSECAWGSTENVPLNLQG